LYHARYYNVNDNIFVQIQQQPVPDQGLEEAMNKVVYKKPDLFPLYQQLRAPDTDLLQDPESLYLHFFLQKLPLNIGFNQLFPSVFGIIYARSTMNEGLRFMTLAVSSFMTDTMEERPPLRSYRYWHLAIPHIQQALTTGKFDDSLVYSVFFAAYLHVLVGEIASTRRHLEGLRLLLKRYLTVPHDFGVESMPPEMMLICRMAIKIDHYWAVGDQELIFPLVSQKDDVRRLWVQPLTDRSQPEMIEWALAQFALDDLLTRAISVNKRAIQLRSAAGRDDELTERAIRSEAAKLLKEHHAWNERRCVMMGTERAEAEQCALRLEEQPSEDARFLDHPPLNLMDKLYGAMRIQYYWVLIYITFITHPKPGPYPYERFQAAIDVCRTYASVGWSHTCGVCRVVIGFYLTGLTLGEPMYPKGFVPGLSSLKIEFGWIASRLLELDRACGYRSGLQILNILKTTWRSEGSHWSHFKAGHNK